MQKESWMLNPQCSELMSEWKVRSWLLNAQAANLPLKEGAEGMSVQSGHGQEAFWETLKKKKKKHLTAQKVSVYNWSHSKG